MASENHTNPAHLIYLIALFSGKNEADIKPEMGILTDLGLDSYDAIELVMQVEEDFGIEIPDELAERILTVGDAMQAIREALADLSPTPPAQPKGGDHE